MASESLRQRLFGRHHPHRKKVRGYGYFRRFGPGLVTGAADDDPSGIGTYAQVGAATGYRLLWAAPYMLPFAYAVEETCARLALVSGTGLAGLIKKQLPRPVLLLCVCLVAVANIVNISADLSSMSAVVVSVVPIGQQLGVVIFGVAIAIAEIFIPYHQYARVLRWLCLSLLAYVVVLFVADVNWSDVVHSILLPEVEWRRADIAAIIALAGTTISPYLFFWQAAEEVEAENLEDAPPDRGHMRAMRLDVFGGMFSGIFIMFAIMTTSAATLHASGVLTVDSPQDAAHALEPIAGSLAGLLFALGILGTGLLAIPVLAGSTAYAVSETFGWRDSLEDRPLQDRAFYGVIVVSIGVGIGLSAFGVNPLHALFFAALLNGLAAPVLLLVIWWLARDKKLLGLWRSKWWSQWLVGGCAVLMTLTPILWLLAPA